jgi:hypothetical protein
MKNFQQTFLIILMFSSMLFLQACQDEPAEEASSETVQARSDAADILNNAAADLSNAALEAANRLEEACEEQTDDNC